MTKPQRRCLSLELLEDRWVPATIRFDGSNLAVSNLNVNAGKSALVIAQQADGSLKVTDNGAANGSYFVTGNLTVSGNNATDTVTITLNKGAGTNSLAGNLYFRGGNGSNSVTLATTAAGGNIGGNLYVNFGSGANLFDAEPNLGGQTAANLTIGGSAYFTGRAGSAQLVPSVNIPNLPPAHSFVEFGGLTMAGQYTNIGGSITVQNIGETLLSAGENNGLLTVGGGFNALLSAVGAPYADAAATGSTTTLYNNYVVMATTAKVLGTVNISSTSGSTYVLADANVGGSLNANLGPGFTTGGAAGNAPGNVLDLNFNVTPGNPAAAPMTVGGNVNYLAGNANNTLLFDDNGNAPLNPLLVGGSVNVNFGNGNNNYEFVNDTAPGGDVFINGNLSIRAGNGSNNIASASPFAFANPGAAIPFLASVQGNESFVLGNGSNTVDLGTAPGGSVFFDGGNGANQFTLENSTVNGGATQYYNNFSALFGSGSNTFTLGDTAGGNPVSVSGQAIGGTGTNLFTQNSDASPITNRFLLRNF